jgi:hypothetical protein
MKTTLFLHFKQRLFKASAGALIFVSIVLLGGAIVTMALPSSLDDIKSTNADNQLTSENRDYLVDQVKVLSGKIATASLWKKDGQNIYYTGNVGIGIKPLSSARVYISNTDSSN